MAERVVEDLKSLKLGDHLCSLYENREQQFSIVVPFLKYGLEGNQKCIYVVDEGNASQEVKNALREGNIDAQKYLNSGQLSVVSFEDFYIRDGEFEPSAAMRRIKEEEDLALSRGYEGLRFAEEATWVLKKADWLEKLVEYEVKLDSFSRGSTVITLCQYDKLKFAEEVLLDTIRMHPIVVLPGLMCRNCCCYFPPSELFAEEGKEYPEELDWRLETLKKCIELQRQSAWWQRYSALGEHHREAVDKFIEAIVGLDEEIRQAFIDLFSRERYGSFTLVFKAGRCIGFDWKVSHRTHEIKSKAEWRAIKAKQ